jgi:pyruvate formate lyase activating enzyme
MVCAQECPSKALRAVGQFMTVEEVMEKVEADRIFYENSGGGVTFSGGEPTIQFEFLKELLEDAGRKGLHRVLETNGNIAWRHFAQLLPKLETVLFDIRNHLIHKNLERLANGGRVPWIPRFPFIPGINDGPKHLLDLGRRVRNLGAMQIDLLPYHRLGESKRLELGMSKEKFSQNFHAPSEEEIERAVKIFKKAGLVVNVGG